MRPSNFLIGYTQILAMICGAGCGVCLERHHEAGAWIGGIMGAVLSVMALSLAHMAGREERAAEIYRAQWKEKRKQTEVVP